MENKVLYRNYDNFCLFALLNNRPRTEAFSPVPYSDNITISYGFPYEFLSLPRAPAPRTVLAAAAPPTPPPNSSRCRVPRVLAFNLGRARGTIRLHPRAICGARGGARADACGPAPQHPYG